MEKTKNAGKPDFLESNIPAFKPTEKQKDVARKANADWAAAVEKMMPGLMERAGQIQDLLNAAEEQSALLNADLVRMEKEAREEMARKKIAGAA